MRTAGIRTLLTLAGVVALSGCLTSAPPAPTHWTISFAGENPLRAATPKYPVVRLSSVTVRAPYDRMPLIVLRPDGSLAFDEYNVFASAPNALLKGAVADALEATGMFAGIVPSGSAVAAPMLAEVTVTELGLDCREPGKREATVALTVVLVEKRGVVASARGRSAAPTADGDYSKAFSAALNAALAEAVRKLP